MCMNIDLMSGKNPYTIQYYMHMFSADTDIITKV